MTLTTKAFVLCAGLGTRFKPQSLFCPKPALPIFNLPQALYSTSALKEFGVNHFFYNSHHLPRELELHLKPYFKNKAFYEEHLLDSAGGIAHLIPTFKNDSKSGLESESGFDSNFESDFWVVNGDSFISYDNVSFLHEALALHKDNKALATLIGISKKKSNLSNLSNLNGLKFDSNNRFTGLSREEKSLHFIGLYLLSTEIFKHIRLQRLKLFDDLLLKPEIQERVFIYKAPKSITWSETGNETDFIDCVKSESKSLLEKKENSFVYRTHKNWGLSDHLDEKLERFLKTKHWGLNSYNSNHPGDFVCVPENSFVDDSINLKNTVVLSGLKVSTNKNFNDLNDFNDFNDLNDLNGLNSLNGLKNFNDFNDGVLVHPSQWR